jgi:hypothetical protein
MIWRKYGCSAGLRNVQSAPSDSSKKHTQMDMQHDALQKLKSPAVVRLTRNQPQLHDPQHRRVLVHLDHLHGVASEEGTQQRDESWDRALLSPHGRREQEREQGAVVEGYALVQRQHLGGDLEDIAFVFCNSQNSVVA